MMHIQTVLGRIHPEQLGHCQIHEHIWVDPTPASRLYPQLQIDRFEDSLAELRHYFSIGGRTIVDAQPLGAGRDVVKLAELSQQSNVQIVTVTGFHRPMFYPESHWIHSISAEHAADLFASEITSGAFIGNDHKLPTDRSPYRAGLVKAALGNDLDEWTMRLVTAAGLAARKTGCALMLHTEFGQNAVEVIHFLKNLGLPANKVIVCHVDRQAENLAPHLNIAKTGAYLDYDTIGRFKYHDDKTEIDLIRHMISAGHLNQLMLSLDTTAERLTTYGGSIGLNYLIETFIPMLQQTSLEPLPSLKMMVENPARILCRTH